MTPRLNVFSIVVSDMVASLVFYRTLGLEIPTAADQQPHVLTMSQPGTPHNDGPTPLGVRTPA